MISITYLISVLIMIRVGEKILQAQGAKRPLLFGSAFTFIGLLLLSLTFLPDIWYIISSVVGYLLLVLDLECMRHHQLIRQLPKRRMRK